ncbi:MAG: hypothetical protein JNK82_28690 [Myxococcaceae bacterium]|nr:hypothetical protein [Myxococcaceae bacterium]
MRAASLSHAPAPSSPHKPPKFIAAQAACALQRSFGVRWVLTCVLAVTAGACRREQVEPTPSEVAVAPLELDFGRIALGAAHTLTVTVQNRGAAPEELTLALEGPFTALDAPTRIDGAGEVVLHVVFAPAHVGAAGGAVKLGANLPRVSLRGEGIAACTVSEPCRLPHFDLETRTCIERNAGEGSACTSPCIAQGGTCRAGACVGVATRCIDGDACTVDACAADGTCLHPPVECPVEDPCQATYCDRDAGCAALPVEDGVPCGEATCEAAHICLSGRCELRTRPTAALDCRYTELSASSTQTCAVTAGGRVRCWGDNYADALGRGYGSTVAPPGFVWGLTGARSVATDDYTTWVAREAGDVVQTNGPTVLPIDATALAATGSTVCGVERGTARCATDDAGVIDAARDVVSLSMQRGSLLGAPGQACVALFDGGVRCGPIEALTAVDVPAPATSVVSGARGSGCTLHDGQVYCWGAVLDGGAGIVWDAGVTAIASRHHVVWSHWATACAAVDRRVECIGYRPGRYALPSPARALVLGDSHGCALLIDGNVACWGDNRYGQLGDRSGQPLGVQLRPGAFTWLGSAQGLLAETNGEVHALGTTSTQSDDAGATWSGLPPTQRLPGFRSGYETGCRCHHDDGGARCVGVGPLPDGLPTACVPTWSIGNVSRVCVSNGGLEVRCYEGRPDGGAKLFTAWDAGGDVVALRQAPGFGVGEELCALRADGTIRCHETTNAATPESLSGVADFCIGDLSTAPRGCARLDGGAVRCWGGWVGSAEPIAPRGVWPVVRQLACGRQHFCTLSGANIVQCWGDNMDGELGLDGPYRTTAVSVPMPEPVVSLSASESSTCALLGSGRLACWGSNGGGVLGVPELLSAPTPRIVTQ